MVLVSTRDETKNRLCLILTSTMSFTWHERTLCPWKVYALSCNCRGGRGVGGGHKLNTTSDKHRRDMRHSPNGLQIVFNRITTAVVLGDDDRKADCSEVDGL